jgi:hypothetical protein
MRVDKEALIKHNWWILLGVFVLLWLVCVVLINTSAADVGGKAKKDFESARSDINTAAGKNPKNSRFNEPWIKYGETYKGQKERVWGDAWEVQKGLFEWPKNDEVNLQRLQYPDDEIAFSERSEYKERLWKKQFENLEAEFDPIEFTGGSGGFVQIMMPGFAGGAGYTGGGGGGGGGADVTQQRQSVGLGGGGGGNSLARAQVVANPASRADAGVWDHFWGSVPSEEECWLAQEDFWVKRELLRIVKAAVMNVARFDEDKNAENKDMPEGIVGRHVFRNNLWEINFLVERQGRQWLISDRSTIKNLHPAQRTVPLSSSPSSGGLHFFVKQGNKKYPFKVDGEPLPYKAIAAFRKQWQVDSIDFRSPFELEQEFETANCPIRLIRTVQLGKHSHRTAGPALLVSKMIKPKSDDLAAGAAGAAPTAAKPATPGLGGGGPPPGASSGAAATDLPDFTPNHLPRHRYLFTTDQCRHIPVALLVVVDQTHKDQLLVALANSRLRVQTTQVQFRHISGESVPANSRGASPHEEDENLVEMAVYGIASLYERYPPKNAPPPSPPPASPGAAGGQTPGAPSKPATSPAGQTPGPAAKATPTTAAATPKPADTSQPTPPTGGAPAPKPAEAAKPADTKQPPPVAKPPDAGKQPETQKPTEPAKPADKGKDADPKKP